MPSSDNAQQLLDDVLLLLASAQNKTSQAKTEIPPDPTPIPPTDLRVPAGSDLQTVYDAAQPGQRLLLDPAGTWPTLQLRKKGTGGRIEITTDGAPDVPNQRLTSGAGLAKLGGGPGPVLTAEPGGGGAILHNLELLPSTDTGRFSTVVYLGTGMERDPLDLAHDVTLRRVYSVVDWTKQRQRRFVRAECTGFDLLDSYIAGYNYPTPDDAQGFIATNSPGPFRIENCYLEATGENILFGGGDPQITNLVPGEAGTLIRKCHLFKPLAWKTALRGYVKNLLEIKNGKNILVDGCVLENTWVDAQAGDGVLLTVRNQDKSAPWSTIENVEIRNTRIIGCAQYAVTIMATDDRAGVLSVRARSLKLSNVQCERTPRGLYISRGPDSLTLEHCTFADIKGHYLSFENGQVTAFSFVNTLARSGNYGVHSPVGLGTAALKAYTPAYVWQGVGTEKSTDPTTSIAYPTGTTIYAAGTIAYDQALGRYGPILVGTDGLPAGADLSHVPDPR